MYHLQKATQVTSGTDDAATLRWLAQTYAYPPKPTSPPCLTRPYVRANFVSSIDGAVTHNGRSAELAGPGDHALFHVLRALADVVLVGARTATVEDYGQPAEYPVFAGDRRRAEQTPAPALALVSRTLAFPIGYPPLSNPDTVVFTCRDAPRENRQALVDTGATLIDCGEDTVDLQIVLDRCAERGWHRVLCEGGPTLLGSLVTEDLVDEICLTISPNLVSGDAGRIAHDRRPGVLRSMRAETILTDDDGFVFSRWVRSAPTTH